MLLLNNGMMHQQMSKHDSRKQIITHIKELSQSQRAVWSLEISTSITTYITNHALALTHIALFFPLTEEVDLTPAYHTLLGTKHLYAPRYNTTSQSYEFCAIHSFENLKKGKYGILEPDDTCPAIDTDTIKKTIDIWIVPGLAFDQAGHRLGRGKGYYDQFLAGAKGIKIGVCFHEQILSEIPTDTWDIAMNLVITNRDIYHASTTRNFG